MQTSTLIPTPAAIHLINQYAPVWEKLFKTRHKQETAAERERFQIIADHRQRGEDTGDLLSMLLAARDEDGQPMSEQHR